jgi:hypothetical protein
LLIVGYNVVLNSRYGHIRPSKTQIDTLGLPRWQAVRVFLIRTTFIANPQTCKVRVIHHHRIRTFHPAAVANRNR